MSYTDLQTALDEPSVLQFEVGRDFSHHGWLMLCTDGFWDALGDSDEFATLVTQWVRQHPVGADALSLARTLVENACQQRGHDNTTVALLSIGGEAAAQRNRAT
jgi:serine/threonine protein phosphatase PrpC